MYHRATVMAMWGSHADDGTMGPRRSENLTGQSNEEGRKDSSCFFGGENVKLYLRMDFIFLLPYGSGLLCLHRVIICLCLLLKSSVAFRSLIYPDWFWCIMKWAGTIPHFIYNNIDI